MLQNSLSQQVSLKTKDTEKVSTVEANKVKEESMAIAGGRCWKGVSLRALQVSGELFELFVDH